MWRTSGTKNILPGVNRDEYKRHNWLPNITQARRVTHELPGVSTRGMHL